MFAVASSRRRTGSTSQVSATSGDSEGSVEGQYNFAAADDEIDEGMFAGDRNSASFLQDPGLRYLDSAASTSENNMGDVIRLEEYKPRLSPSTPRKNGTALFEDMNFNQSKGTEDDHFRFAETTQGEGFVDSPKGSSSVAENGPSSDDFLDSEPPDWVPPPPPVNKNEPPVYAQVNKARRTSPDNFVKGSIESTQNEPVDTRPTNSQDNSIKGSAESPKNELFDNESDSEDTSEDDDAIEWPAPPPPPQKSSRQPDDDWERPLPPEIIALPGKRNRVASWARDDDTEDSSNFDDLTKI